MAFVKKLALGSIFISILCIFGMSHNANAVNINFENYSISNNIVNFGNKCRLQSGQTAPTGLTFCTFTAEAGNSLLKEIQSNSSYSFKKGDIIEYYFIVATRLNYNAPGGSYYILENANDNGLITLNVESVDDFNSADFHGTQNNDGALSTFWANYRIAKVYKITQYVPSDGNYNFGFNVSSTSQNRYIMSFYQTLDSTFVFTLKNAVVYSYSESKENKEVEEKTQEAVDDSQAAGSGSSSSASQGGANLLSAITGFFNVITSAQPTNCRFNAPLNTYFGNQNLNVDLCALDLPSGIGALTSIIAIGILIPFAIHMFNKFIALFRSFQS